MVCLFVLINNVFTKQEKVLISHIGLPTSILSINENSSNLVAVKSVGFPKMYEDEYAIKLEPISGNTYTIQFENGYFMYHDLKENNISGSQKKRKEIVGIPEYIWEISQDSYGTKIKLKNLCLGKYMNGSCQGCFTLWFTNCNNSPNQLWEVFYFPEDTEMSKKIGMTVQLANR